MEFLAHFRHVRRVEVWKRFRRDALAARDNRGNFSALVELESLRSYFVHARILGAGNKKVRVRVHSSPRVFILRMREFSMEKRIRQPTKGVGEFPNTPAEEALFRKRELLKLSDRIDARLLEIQSSTEPEPVKCRELLAAHSEKMSVCGAKNDAAGVSANMDAAVSAGEKLLLEFPKEETVEVRRELGDAYCVKVSTCCDTGDYQGAEAAAKRAVEHLGAADVMLRSRIEARGIPQGIEHEDNQRDYAALSIVLADEGKAYGYLAFAAALRNDSAGCDAAAQNALTLLRDAIAADCENAETYHNLADVYYLLGDDEKQKRALQEAEHWE